jgi:hypothetical protein
VSGGISGSESTSAIGWLYHKCGRQWRPINNDAFKKKQRCSAGHAKIDRSQARVNRPLAQLCTDANAAHKKVESSEGVGTNCMVVMRGKMMMNKMRSTDLHGHGGEFQPSSHPELPSRSNVVNTIACDRNALVLTVSGGAQTHLWASRLEHLSVL